MPNDIVDHDGRGEFAKNWPLIITCMAGVSVQGVAIYSLGQFMAPLEATFAWTRTQSSAGLTLALFLGCILAPIIGRAVDVMNFRLLAIPGLIITGLAVAAFSLTTGDIKVWLGLWGVQGLGVALVSPTVWTAMIASRFTANRSFAMALALCGSTLSAAGVPPVARYLIDAVGWRHTYQILGLAWCGAVLLLAVVFVRDRRLRPASAGSAQAPSSGAHLRTVFLSATFVKLAIVIFVVMGALSAYGIHLAPALVDSGFDRRQAADIAGVSGLALLGGKFGVGWFFDRVSLSVVSTAIMLALAIACGLLGALHGQVPLALAACIAFGASAGGMFTVMACVTGRYFRPEDFGVVFGALSSATALSAAVGPAIASVIHDQTGSYRIGFWAGIGVAAGAALILRTLAPVGVSSPAAPATT